MKIRKNITNVFPHRYCIKKEKTVLLLNNSAVTVICLSWGVTRRMKNVVRGHTFMTSTRNGGGKS